MRILLLATMAMTMCTAAFAQSLSGDQIREKLAGNTFSGIDDGECYSQVLTPDGGIFGQTPSGRYYGRWNIDGNHICFTYFESKSASDCTTVRLRGNQIVWEDNTTALLEKSAAGSQAYQPHNWPRFCHAKATGESDDNNR